MRRRFGILIAFGVAALCGCGGDADAGDAGDAGVDLGVDAPFSPPPGDGTGPAVTGLGDACTSGACLSPPACAFLTAECATGYCLTDQRQPAFAGDYCTIDCAPRPCPHGYHCEAVASSPLPSVCVADPPVCGNGVIERGETCDDGNTTPGDGCDASCHREPPPPQHLAVDLSLSGTEHALDGGADTPRVAVSHVESNLDVAPGCGTATSSGGGGAIGDGGVWEPVLVTACPPFGTVGVNATLAYATGTYDVNTPIGSYALSVCADVTFADASGCAQRYCAATGATPPAATLTVGANPDGGVHGTFDAHLVAQGDGGCASIYGSSLDVTGVFDRGGL